MSESTPHRLTPRVLRDLQRAGLPRMTYRDLGLELREWPPPDEVVDQLEGLDLYLRRFTPMKSGTCVCCGAAQGGRTIIDSALVGRFRWGVVHGEGHCLDCGWPARAIHYDLPIFERLERIMQYHPDELAFSREAYREEEARR